MTARRALIMRLIAAIPVGYTVSALAGTCLCLWLPFSRADKAIAGVLAGLIVWPVIFIASFGIRDARRLVTLLLPLGLLMAALIIAGFRRA
ncbi:DUF3810 domain-containing protein [Gluconobacter kanchanaburiensis]|uniref:Iron uptake protein n=1 Tax=Gluconobacter kanchanaburiensis NBRC 103587 TaxID=1307948 RepID=A0A511B8Y4_9PROT|nr:DUF3810 domain-containing protein [Gluconobacter kanchanaburiensis]MBF0862634.1 hypothetical protein [Gluconobacter kanchanaburiensis]GBR71879.1 hypothetical protein AA103587_2581 [Gluconobacter kanchanaburiensis NBRC 103587]GEK96868.1 hypothetical protein GKA01_20650 [Gluconobacter kanchanaburiensis NBRC 103587]